MQNSISNYLLPTTVPEINIPFSLKIKDPGSAATHFVGAIASIAAAPFLIAHYISADAGGIAIVAVAIFALSMLLLYSASTAYHTVVTNPETDKLLKKIDHMMIFVLIAGTYTPVCLTALRPSFGIYLLAGIWGLAALGMIFKFFWVTCPKWLSSTIYIGMGWLCVFAVPQILRTVSFSVFLFLLAGGIVYTVGGVLYAMKFTLFNNRHKYFGSHEIFHVLVMLGNLLQFIAIYNIFE